MAKILTYPDHTLLQISGLVRNFKDPKLKETIDELIQTAKENSLKALAAIQIGIPLRIIVFEHNGAWLTLINPTIFGKEGKLFDSTETDESLPGMEATIKRYPKIKVMYEDKEQNQCFLTLEGEDAVLMQRKIDMVFGGYLFDKLSKKAQKEFFKQYGSYGDTCPRYFIKDRILLGLRYFLTLHFILLLLSLFWEKVAWVKEQSFTLFGIELIWLIIYVAYARYETKKYKNCTSCQNANIIGTSGLYLTGIVALLLFSLLEEIF